MSIYTSQIIDLLKKMQDESYKNGWEAAVASILNAAQKPSQNSFSPKAIRDIPTRYGVTVASKTEEIVFLIPGLTGIEIVRKVREEMPDKDIHDKAVRTPLYRLQSKGKIYIKDGRWYPIK